MRVASIKPDELALVDGEELVLIGDLLAQRGVLSQRSSMIDFIAQYDSVKNFLASAVSTAKRIRLDPAALEPPVRPSKIWAAAFNYKRGTSDIKDGAGRGETLKFTPEQGLPLIQFLPGSLKEGSSVTAYNGTLSHFNRAPHPNAAKVAANWLLSREGQTAWLDSNQKTGGLQDSLREDIPKEKISEWARRVKGAKFLWLDPAWIDELGSIRDIIKKALASAGKGK